MPVYHSDDFLVIYSKVIRSGEKIPFDCYILLALSKKVAVFLSKGTIVSPEKMERLKQYDRDKLYIRKEDQPLYLKYLNEFLTSPENQLLIQQDLATGESSEELGIPPEILSQLGVAHERTSGDPVLGSVVEVLKNQTERLQQDIHLSQALSEDEKTVIKDVTLKIEDEIIRLGGEPDADMLKATIQSVTEHIKEEIIRVSSNSNLEDQEKEQYKQMIEDLNKSVEDLSNSQNQEDLTHRKDKIQSQIMIIRGAVSPQKEDLVSTALQNMIGEIEKKMGRPLDLKISRSHEPDNEQPGTGRMDPLLIENLKTAVANQEKAIQDLTDKIKAAVPLFGDLKTRWFSFQMLIKRKIDAGDQMKTKSITQQFYDFEGFLFKGLNEERKNLKKMARQLNFIVTGDTPSDNQNAIDPDEVSILSAMSANPPSDQNGDEEGGAGGSSAANMDSLVSENNVLKVQLENAQALVETISKKTNELEEMLRSGGEYARSLEEDLQETKKKLEEVLTDTQSHESDKRRLSEGLEDMSTALYRQKADQTSESEKYIHQQQRLHELERTLRIYTEKLGNEPSRLDAEAMKKLPPDVQAALIEKDNSLKDLTRKLETRVEEVASLKKELETLKSTDRKFELEKKDLSKRIEKQRVEFENLKQQQKTIELKSVASANLLSQAQKTINKLTEENGELRTDRTKYIRKTNEALAEHKSLVSQAMSLNSKMQVEMEKNRSLESQIESHKEREKEIAKKVQAMSTQIAQLESAKKKLEDEFKKTSSDAKQSEIDQLRQIKTDLEKKLEFAKNESKATQDRLVKESKKVTELTQLLKKKAS